MVLENWMRAAWTSVDRFFFGPADARVYGLTRISLSFAAILSWMDIWPQRYVMLADDGLVPPRAVLPLQDVAPYFSVFYWVRSHGGIDLVMLLALLALLALGAGILPRLAVIAAYLWHLSYTYYTFPALAGWDLVLRASFFILAISPVGDPYCFEYRRRRADAPSTLPRYGLVLLRWQVMLIYVATVWLKVGNDYWRKGEVLEYFGLSIFSSTEGTWFLQWPSLMALLTYLTLVIELFVPFALYSKRWRRWGLALGLALHLGIALTSTLAIFSVVILATYCAFLDGDDIDHARRVLTRTYRRILAEEH